MIVALGRTLDEEEADEAGDAYERELERRGER